MDGLYLNRFHGIRYLGCCVIFLAEDERIFISSFAGILSVRISFPDSRARESKEHILEAGLMQLHTFYPYPMRLRKFHQRRNLMLPVGQTQGDGTAVLDKLFDKGKAPEGLTIARFDFQGDDVCADDVLQVFGCVDGDNFSSVDDAHPLA